jgi:hypothetical protein
MRTHSLAPALLFLAAGLASCAPAPDGTEPAASSTTDPSSLMSSDGNDLVESAATATCNGTTGQWKGCRGTGCSVCTEKLYEYPFYFDNHPGCVRNDTCAGQFFTCNSKCPAPTNADKQPKSGTCSGTAGQWAGCRGNGCEVCSEKMVDYPFYFLRHPKCVRNDTCAGQFFTCNSNCPAPTAADQTPPAGTCNGTTGQWAGCRGNGCEVCSEKMVDYPFYFHRHPDCVRNDTCAGQFFTCNAACPAPTALDKSPPSGTCNGSTGAWAGCRGNGCEVCSEKLAAYPYYFLHHPLCVKNDTCAGQFFTCNANCPQPSSLEQSPPGGMCDGTQGTWAGCRGNGCAVCSENLVNYPNYFKNHPSCLKNDSCAGQFFTCNAKCPAPSDADR